MWSIFGRNPYIIGTEIESKHSETLTAILHRSVIQEHAIFLEIHFYCIFKNVLVLCQIRGKDVLHR